MGASICRSGVSSGFRCGWILTRNETVNYPEGTVFGLARTSACGAPGDSGGSFLRTYGAKLASVNGLLDPLP